MFLSGVGETLPPAGALFAPVADRKVIGLAVSGGPDSLALMVLAAAWAEGTDKRLIVYTVDHGLRADAAEEAAQVAALAGQFGLEARIVRWEGDKPVHGVQAAARAARYRLIGTAMAADGAELLVTGHHRDDQAETVLMRLSHGSGLTGLAGMRTLAEVEGIIVFRPFLDLPKSALAGVVAAAELDAIADPSNDDMRFERVRWRQRLVALGEEGLTADRLAGFARRVGRAEAVLDRLTDEAIAANVTVSAFGVVRARRSNLGELDAEIAIRVLARMLGFAGGGQAPHALGVVEALAEDLLSCAGADKRTVLGAVVETDGETVLMWREGRDPGPADIAVEAAGSAVWDGRFRIENLGLDWSFKVAAGTGVTREMAEAVLGVNIADPMAALRTAPVVWRADGQVIALGTHVLGPEVSVVPVAV